MLSATGLVIKLDVYLDLSAIHILIADDLPVIAGDHVLFAGTGLVNLWLAFLADLIQAAG